MRLMIFFVVVLAAALSESAAAVSLAPVFSDHAVFQQGVPIAVWGDADAGEQVEVRFAGQTKRAISDDDGRWRITLDALAASHEPQTLHVAGASDSVQVNDILIGEVWLCSGQSNIEWPLRATQQAEAFIAGATDDLIRVYSIPHIAKTEPQPAAPGKWVVCAPETAPNFSAVAYHFARILRSHLGAPIGLVDASWGGSAVEAWIPMERLEELPAAEPFLNRYRQHLAEMSTDIAEFTGEAVDMDDWEPANLPATFREVGHDIDGVIWFRRDVTIPEDWEGRQLTLTLGAIDDRDETYFGGTRIGAGNNWRQERIYAVPPQLVRAGSVTIAVRVHDTGGAGGFTGSPESMQLTAADPAGAINLAGEWRLRVATTTSAPPAQHRPAELYNGMIHPVRAYAYAGAIWYQGESNSNGGRGEEYYTLFPAMIEAWRERLGHDDLPFYFVQLPLFTNNEPNSTWRYPVVRDAQLHTYRTVPNTGMAVTLELGEANDIHPRNKHDVGDRLARWALVDVYGRRGMVKCGPIFKSARRDGSAVRLTFDLFGSTLAASAEGGVVEPRDGTTVQIVGFEVAGADGTFHPAEARADWNSVVVRSEQVESPRAVRYAWMNNTAGCNLVSAAGLPASPFQATLDE